MKKMMAILLSAAIAVTTCACGNDKPADESSQIVEGNQDGASVAGRPEESDTSSDMPVSDEKIYEYEETDGAITITQYLGDDKAVTIPDMLEGKPVVAIGENAFMSSRVESVVIPEGVTSIGAGAFCNDLLAEIIIPESVTDFGYSKYEATPFYGTPWMEKKRQEDPLVIVNGILLDGKSCTGDVVIPESVSRIHQAAFAWNLSLTGVSFPESLEVIEANAFNTCQGLREIVLSDNISYIGSYAFYGCTSLEDVTFPDRTMELGTKVFGGGDARYATPWIRDKRKENPLVIVNDILVDASACTGDVVIPDNVKVIAHGAFFDEPHSSSVTSVKLPEGITEISVRCFTNCLNLTSVTIPDSVTEIQHSAFYNCYALGEVNLPDGVEYVGEDAFYGCRDVQLIFQGEVYDYEHRTDMPGAVIESWRL